MKVRWDNVSLYLFAGGVLGFAGSFFGPASAVAGYLLGFIGVAAWVMEEREPRGRR